VTEVAAGIKKYGVAVLLLAAFMFLTHVTAGTVCMVNALFGMPCPGCGLTRAWYAALGLRVGEAFAFHPLFAVPFVYVGIWVWTRVRKVNPPWFKTLSIGVLAAFLAVYVIRMVMFFPHTEPFVLNFDSFLLRFLGVFFW
jgi:hypothetical protein